MWSAEQRRRAGGSRLALSEPQASFASRPDLRVAQGSWRSQPRNLGSPSFWLLFLGEARKSTPASKAEPQAHSTPHTHQHSTKASQPNLKPPHAAICRRNRLANDRQTSAESAWHQPIQPITLPNKAPHSIRATSPATENRLPSSTAEDPPRTTRHTAPVAAGNSRPVAPARLPATAPSCNQ